MEELLSILENMHPEVDFETEEGLIDNGILDSFDIISLITEISEEMDIAIPADAIVPENFNSLKKMCELIESLRDE